ncbi:MAG: sulfurtransferase TusA family protein [Cyanobacteriota bacterium]|nr:sulfurtransferase TusA family protein [Cyanobacteriota bacterium]
MTDLDLRGTPCPLNFIRTRLALEKLPEAERLRVDLDRGEPEAMVRSGIVAEGHTVEQESHPDDPGAVRLLIRRGQAVDADG